MADIIEAGDLTREDSVPASPVLRAMVDGFKVSSATDIDGRVTAAIAAVNAVPPEPRPDGTHAEPPEGDFRQMLGEIAEGYPGEDGVEEEGHRGGVDPEAVSVVTEIERLGGATGAVARRNSLAAVGAGKRRRGPSPFLGRRP